MISQQKQAEQAFGSVKYSVSSFSENCSIYGTHEQFAQKRRGLQRAILLDKVALVLQKAARAARLSNWHFVYRFRLCVKRDNLFIYL